MAGFPRSSLGKVFVARLRELAQYASRQGDALCNTDSGQWYRPDAWEPGAAGVFDVPSMHTPFSRTEQEDQFIAATADPRVAGTVGDLQIVAAQGECLQTMERAFRARHHSTVRMRLHPSARLRGHGHANGLILAGLIGHIENTDRLNRGEGRRSVEGG